jgi:hypothetical protein
MVSGDDAKVVTKAMTTKMVKVRVLRILALSPMFCNCQLAPVITDVRGNLPTQ